MFGKVTCPYFLCLWHLTFRLFYLPRLFFPLSSEIHTKKHLGLDLIV